MEKPTLILRHKKENLNKCSLRGLENRSDFCFYTYPKEQLPDLSGYLLLTPDAPPLSPQDHPYAILLLDGTWRYAEKMAKRVPLDCLRRSIPPPFKTAYPRHQDIESGLASIEALYIAFNILGKSTTGLLDHYYWKQPFLDYFDQFT